MSKRSLVDGTATAMRMLVSEAAPAYCKGTLSGAPQPAGDFVWARLEPAHLMISQAMSIEHVARLWHVLGLLPGIFLVIAGRKVRLALQIRRLGPPTGEAPVKRWGTVEFDLADGRVLYLVYGRLLKRLLKVRSVFAHAPVTETRPVMRLFGKVENKPGQ